MPYITTAELAERPGSREIALLATSDGMATVDYALMDATLRGQDRSTWPAGEVAQADAALQRVQDAIAEADALIDGYLATRGYALPLQLSPTSTGKSMLTVWARAIARYLLNGSRITDESKDPVARDYRDALKRLADIAAGKLSLGGTDPQAPANATSTDVRFDSAPAVFGRHELRHFR